MKLLFNVNYKPDAGDTLQLNIREKEGQILRHNLEYTDNGNWTVEVDYFSRNIRYYYSVISETGEMQDYERADHILSFPHNIKEFTIYDSWNKKNFPENYLNNKVFLNAVRGIKMDKFLPRVKHTHWFRIEAPLYNKDWRIVILGNCPELGSWEENSTVAMLQTEPGIWNIAIECRSPHFIQYKYGIQSINSGEVLAIEHGENRWAVPNDQENNLHIKADHYFRYQINQLYRAAGVAIPVFSLRCENSFGVGEFSDLKIFGDWAKQCGFNIIQALPVNDTTSDYTWKDNYPYAAISTYALHPQYLSIINLKYSLPEQFRSEYDAAQLSLNAEKSVNYDEMIALKWKFIRIIFEENQTEICKDRSFQKFRKENEEWLIPYASFCVQRDKFKTVNFQTWKTHRKYIPGKIAPMFSAKNKEFGKAMLHCWVQYQLHLQLKDAVAYLHTIGISLKGDLPIGINRNSVEAWTEPELFNLDFQTGAPPDPFSELGQNWGFPTYNWSKMADNDYEWWKKRFRALEQYFDAMRIDHILGFFRIWQIPENAVQGILGYFSPAIAVTEEEFAERGIPFEMERYCKPFITDEILLEVFGNEKEAIKNQFFSENKDGGLDFRPEFDSQKKIKQYFLKYPQKNLEDQMLALSANVLFIKEELAGNTVFHPRFFLYNTSSYHYLTDREKSKLYKLYINYFFERQDDLWYNSAMKKLPVILDSSDMLICGEDLGLVPAPVPKVMDELAIAALKVQRMPAEEITFYDPRYASYLNVVTASTHDTSTLRQWWLEDRGISVRYFHEQLLQTHGTAPGEMVPPLAEIVLKQHLYTEAMLAIFPLQDWLAADFELRNDDFAGERINIPANFPHNWNYRMHLTIEELLQAETFNGKIAAWITDCGRN